MIRRFTFFIAIALLTACSGAPGLDPALRLELRSAVADAGLAVDRLVPPTQDKE